MSRTLELLPAGTTLSCDSSNAKSRNIVADDRLLNIIVHKALKRAAEGNPSAVRATQTTNFK